MKNKYISPFKPEKINDLKPTGIKIYTFKAGYKRFNEDLLVIVFDKPVKIATAFTKSTTPSAPIIWDKKLHKNNICKVLIVNSGNANAYTGKRGINSIKKYASFASKIFNCKLNQIFISSTGVIGEQLDPMPIINKLKLLNKTKSKNLIHAAKAIMTTDTFPKIVVETIKIKGKKINIYGIAKGSGMIAPNMGTMLSYIFIEASFASNLLNALLKKYIETSFNSISVDGDMSTSDTVVVFAIGNQHFQNIVRRNNIYKLIAKSLNKVMINLAKQIVSDGEGISKLIEVNVCNAKNNNQAKKIAFSIGESLLVKTAIYGGDANWGRVIMAIGKTLENIIPNKLSLSFGRNIIIDKGIFSKKYNEKKLNNYMKNKFIIINLDLKIGSYNRTIWSSDLTKKYIEINADYRS